MLEALATSRNLDSQENTVLSRKALLEGAASWRSETILLAKPLSLAVDYVLGLDICKIVIICPGQHQVKAQVRSFENVSKTQIKAL